MCLGVSVFPFMNAVVKLLTAHYPVMQSVWARFQSGPAAVIAPLGYVELIGTAALGYFGFGNFPDLWTWLGAAIIIVSGSTSRYASAGSATKSDLSTPDCDDVGGCRARAPNASHSYRMPSDREASEGDDPAAQHRHPQIAAASNEYRGRRRCEIGRIARRYRRSVVCRIGGARVSGIGDLGHGDASPRMALAAWM
jgi:hypothetical protein